MITKFFNYYFIGIEFCLIIDEESSLKIKLGSSNLGCLFISMDAISKSSSSSCELSDDNSSTCLDPDSTGNAYQASFKSELMFRVDFPNDFDRPKNEETVYGPMPIMKSEEASYNSMETSNNTTPDESVGLVSDFEPTTLLDEIEMEDDPLKIDSEEENNEDSLPTQPGSSKKRTKSKGKQPIEKTFACDYPGCNASFSRPWKLSAHHCRHTGERPFMCSRVGCTKSYTNPTHLRRHDLKVHGAKDDKTDTRRYKCTHPNCWLVDHPGFCTVPGLRKHEQRHEVLDKNGLVCSDCNMTFTRLNELKTHRFEHDNVLPFKCDYCGRAYLYNLELRKHLRMHKRYKCQVAGCESLEFDSYKELQKHKHIHNKQIVCELCGKEFAMKCRLRVHFEEVHSCEPGATQWPCSVPGCPRVFTRRRNMQQHVRQKHQGPGHVCPFQGCHLRFVWKQSLTKHMQLHLMETETETPPVQPEQKEKGPRARRKDADKPKSATAEILSDVIVDSQTKDQLINKEEFDTDEEIIYQLTESPPLSRSSTADLDVS